MKAQDFAKRAVEILAERGSENGYDNKEERSAAKIAQVFNIVSGRDLTEAEAWLFMMCLKLVREGGKHQDDNCLDLANYAFLRAESFHVHDETKPRYAPGRVEDVALLVAMLGTADKDGFLPWDGGMFIPNGVTRVDVKHRNGSITPNRQYVDIIWRHSGGAFDVVAWRPAK